MQNLPQGELRDMASQMFEDQVKTRWISKADIARVVAVHGIGGVYVDLDIQINRPLDPLLQAGLIIDKGTWKNPLPFHVPKNPERRNLTRT